MSLHFGKLCEHANYSELKLRYLCYLFLQAFLELPVPWGDRDTLQQNMQYMDTLCDYLEMVFALEFGYLGSKVVLTACSLTAEDGRKVSEGVRLIFLIK